MTRRWTVWGAACAAAWAAGAARSAETLAPPSPVRRWEVTPTSLVSRDSPPLQRIDLSVETTAALTSCTLRVLSGGRTLAERPLDPLRKGTNAVPVLLREPQAPADTRWVLSDASGTLAERTLTWHPPRHWTLYTIKSAHVDLGLHDSQYRQRLMGDDFIDQAQRLADRTSAWPEAARFRYVVESLWWWQNYATDRPEPQAAGIAGRYVRKGVFGVGAGHSGNHTQVYGEEELCRSAGYARQARDRWGLPADTMVMADINGLAWPMVTVCADAGIRNLVFLPNAWNPKTVGQSRIDVGWESPLPHLFHWQGPDGRSRLLVWANPHYTGAAAAFGIRTVGRGASSKADEPAMAAHLARLEARYPYDVWLLSNYADNEPPSLALAELVRDWNARWRWPELRTVGDLSEPFRRVGQRFGDAIPTLRGDIPGGWAQHPLSTPALLAAKREADRLLPTAEKLATLARLSDPAFVYPTEPLRRAWDALICNDEHGYGTSYYSGRPVYDTWIQKRDWIEGALAAARTESACALETLAALAPADGPSVFVFNPTLQPRAGTVEVELPPSFADRRSVLCADGKPAAAVDAGGSRLLFRTSEIPPLGYAVFPLGPGDPAAAARGAADRPPTVENDFYRVAFAGDGTIAGLHDKQLGRSLVDPDAPYRCNQFVYTRDAHRTFSSPAKARFEIETSPLGQTVIARMDDAASGAAIEQRVTLPAFEKRIDIDNRLDHVRDLASSNRWYRFGYYAFPFAVPGGGFRVGLNGCTARPREDQTGHGTEAYMAARDWAGVANDAFGVALVQHDSCLVECGKIHANKNAFGEPPATTHLYSYIFNDWLYAHAWVTGPSHINLRYRYSIFSHAGSFRDAHVAQFAERTVTPLLAAAIPGARRGTLPAAPHSFLSADAPDVALLTLKPAEDPGRGVIARLHETDGIARDAVNVRTGWGGDLRFTACSVTEQDRKALDRPEVALAPYGYATLRIEAAGRAPPAPRVEVESFTENSVTLRWKPTGGAVQYVVYGGEGPDVPPDAAHRLAATRETLFTDAGLKSGATRCYRVAAVDAALREGAASRRVRTTTRGKGDAPPAKVGSFRTGLVSAPRAWRGDRPDQLYLQWGQNRDSDLSHYELFRGGDAGFAPDDKTFVARIEPGPCVVVPFEDTGLKPHMTYYYRVVAVDRDGRRGPPSDVCAGTTREP